jgi:gliding motility-associated-like protein
LTSAPGSNIQAVCTNSNITTITYNITGGGTGASTTGLPPGVSGFYSGGVYTISGAPTTGAGSPYNYTVTTSGGCNPATATGRVTVNPDASITLSSAPGTDGQSVCINTAIAPIQYTISGGGTGATVTGLPAGVTGNYSGGVFTLSGSPSVTGAFSYTVTTTGTCLQKSVAGTITISPDAVMTRTSAAGSDNQSVCAGSPINAITYAVSSGGTGATVTGLPNGIIGSFTSGVFTISGTSNTSGIFSYTVTTTGTCKQKQVSGVITIKEIPVANPTNGGNVCEGSDLSLIGGSTPSTVDSYQWTANSFTSTLKNPVINSTTMNSAGQYNLTVTLNNCTSSPASTTVQIYSKPTVQFSVDVDKGCVPLTVDFTNNSTPSSQSSTWTFGDGGTSNFTNVATHEYLNTGCFDVPLTTTTAQGCTDSKTSDDIVCVSSKAIANFAPDKVKTSILNPSFSFSNSSTNATNYLWYFGDGTTSTQNNPIHLYSDQQPGNYTVSLVAKNAGACPDSISLNVEIEDELIFYVPNTFTPDADGLNAIFKPVMESGFDPNSYTLLIFNRWGEVIFKSLDYAIGWDGTLSGAKVQQGTYIWKITFKSNRSDKKYMYDGSVNLLK